MWIFYCDTEVVTIQGSRSKLSPVILSFATNNVILMSSDQHAYDHQT